MLNERTNFLQKVGQTKNNRNNPPAAAINKITKKNSSIK